MADRHLHLPADLQIQLPQVSNVGREISHWRAQASGAYQGPMCKSHSN